MGRCGPGGKRWGGAVREGRDGAVRGQRERDEVRGVRERERYEVHGVRERER